MYGKSASAAQMYIPNAPTCISHLSDTLEPITLANGDGWPKSVAAGSEIHARR